MARKDYMFTSESVSEGHPDKICDRISDAVLDFCLKKDASARVACETFATTNTVVVGGEVGFKSVSHSQSLASEIKPLVVNVVKEIGYEQEGFHWNNLNVSNFIHQQSSDISQGVDKDGAGDQGIMFGYACNETEVLMPAPIYYAHKILKELDNKRRNGYEYMLPDAKSQVSIQYEGGEPKRVDQIVISHQHVKGFQEDIKEDALRPVAKQVLGDLIDESTNWYLNPTGVFEIGGPDGDTGLTGRKIIVDTYGGYAPHGGGAFSGKDPTKVDRSAAYMARWLAKNVVADEMADWCNIQLSYAIGIKEPTSIYVDSNGHNRSIQKYIEDNIDLTPKGIIDRFGLFKYNKYSKNCIYGHFGDKDVPWERIGWK